MEQWEELAAIVPGRVVGKVRGNLLVSEIKLVLWRNLCFGSDISSVIPAVNCNRMKISLKVATLYQKIL